MPDYSMVKTYRGIYHDNEAFQAACHAAGPMTRKQREADPALAIFIEQEAMYQQLETTFYPCRMTVC